MRLRRLDLQRYGHFTGRTIDFPGGPRDLHLMFGPNEAGKSTALSAIEDLLFGIPVQSAFNFLHDYKDLRIGAVLESRSESLAFLRRKGSKDTVLDTDDLPLPGGESVLQPFLAGADRAFYERMFSLDHHRLEQGGREILDARDDIGRMLFAAGAGIADLRQRLMVLEEEADALWGARRSSRRAYTQAADRLEDADRDLRERTVTAAQWEERRAAAAAAEQAHGALEAEYVRLQAEGRGLARIRRLHRDVRRKRELTAELEAMGAVARIPDDAERQLADAESRALEASIRIDTLRERIRDTNEELAALRPDSAVLLRVDDVQLLHERRIEVRRARGDLPKRQAELGASEARLLALAKELGWRWGEPAAVIAALPSRAKLQLARSLLAERGAAVASLGTAREALSDAESRRQRIQENLDAVPAPVDRAGLAAAVAVVSAQGDLAVRLQAASEERDQARRDVERLHAGLRPPLGSPEVLVRATLPTRPEVQRLRDLLLDWDQRDRDLRRQIQDAGEELGRLQRNFERASREAGDWSKEDLAQARLYRDELWRLVERRHLLGEALSAQEQARFAEALEDLPKQFRAALLKADEMADRRFEYAEAVGRLIQMADTMEAQKAVVEALAQRRTALHAEGEELHRDWQVLWEAAPVEPLVPDAMLAWLDTREALLQVLRTRDAADVRHAALLEEERRARRGLLKELGKHGLARELEERVLPDLLQRGVDLLHALEQVEIGRRRAEQDLREATEETERRRREFGRAEEAWAEWRRRWARVIAELGLSGETDAGEIARQLEAIEELQGLAGQVHSLRHDRIEKIQTDIDAFEQSARAFLHDVAPELAQREPEEVVVEIERRLADAQEARKRQLDREGQIRTLEAELATAEGQSKQAQGVLMRLMEIAGVESVPDLRKAIERDAAGRHLRSEIDGIRRMLEQEGDGLPLDDLERECANVDVDQIAAREQALEQELRQLRVRLEAAVEVRAAAREAFAAIGGDDAAARAAAARQNALTELRSASERYVRTRTAAELLKWAIDRYRREKQAPMLRRAGEIFATLTGGAFSALRVEYDERDQPQLTGLRAGGGSVPVPGLSTGTADQLYLALRVASIEDYLDHAPGLPFVADDLFVNFDDQRAGAGFEVLGQLASRTQVLFFTHHRHLVDIARERLGTDLHVEFLAETGSGELEEIERGARIAG
jgi:uncharacterized protein YhaN